MIDHWFYKTVKVDLSDNQDGSKIREIRKPRITKTVLILVAVAIVIGVSFIPFNYENDLKLNFKSFGDYFKAMFTPNKYRTKDWAGWWKFSWESFAKGISAHGVNSAPFLQIFEINFLGTVLGCILSVPVYYLCANNVNHNPFLREPVKVFNDFLRCIPMFILCVILSFIFGIGNTLPCILAIGLFSMGIMYQMMYESEAQVRITSSLSPSDFTPKSNRCSSPMPSILLKSTSEHPSSSPMSVSRLPT